MFKYKLRMIVLLLLFSFPFTTNSVFAHLSVPAQFPAYEESYYFSFKGEQSQASGSLITSKDDTYIPVQDVATLLNLTIEERFGDIHLDGTPSVTQSSEVVGALSKDRTLNEQMKINPAIGATSAVILEDSNTVPIYTKNGNSRLYPSSTTKIMTALLAIEHGHLDDIVIIGKNAVKVPRDSSKAKILPGERLTLEQLVYGLMLPSGNDAAVAIAEHISGSEQKFVQLMNKRAKELGATGTNFMNAHGYHHPSHYTTTNDLAKIAKEASKHPIFMKIAGAPSYKTTYIGVNGLPKTNLWKNGNKLIQKDSQYFSQTVTGGKTGYTSASRYNLVSFAEKNGHQYVVALLKGEKNQRYLDTTKLLQSAYAKRTALNSERTTIYAGAFPGKFVINGEEVTNISSFIRNGTIYVSTDILPLISNQISTVKRGDNQQVKATLDSSLLTFDQVEPLLKDGRMLVPLRAFFEEAGLQLVWNQKERTIEGRSENTTIKMKVDSKHASVNGQHVVLDVPATVQNGRTLVPIRFISESTGSAVDWGRGRVLYLY